MLLGSDEKLIKVWRCKFGGGKNLSNADPDSKNGAATNSNNGESNDASAIGAVKVNIGGNGKLTHFTLTVTAVGLFFVRRINPRWIPFTFLPLASHRSGAPT